MLLLYGVAFSGFVLVQGSPLGFRQRPLHSHDDSLTSSDTLLKSLTTQMKKNPQRNWKSVLLHTVNKGQGPRPWLFTNQAVSEKPFSGWNVQQMGSDFATNSTATEHAVIPEKVRRGWEWTLNGTPIPNRQQESQGRAAQLRLDERPLSDTVSNRSNFQLSNGIGSGASMHVLLLAVAFAVGALSLALGTMACTLGARKDNQKCSPFRFARADDDVVSTPEISEPWRHMAGLQNPLSHRVHSFWWSPLSIWTTSQHPRQNQMHPTGRGRSNVAQTHQGQETPQFLSSTPGGTIQTTGATGIV